MGQLVPATLPDNKHRNSSVPAMLSLLLALCLLSSSSAIFSSDPECDDVGIEPNLCAVLYDETNCLATSSKLSLRPGDQGVLPSLTLGTNLLRTNDAESLIVKFKCKLEVWDRSSVYQSGGPADLVIDRTSRIRTLGRNKYVDSMAEDYPALNEKISAYKCTCRS